MSASYEEVCDERAHELLALADERSCPLYVFWSGGIDSTTALVSLLKNATPAQKKNIIVLLNEDSIAEYPKFHEQHLVGKVRIGSSSGFPDLLGNEGIVTSGHLNDQIFGMGHLRKFIKKFGPDTVHKPYTRDKLRVFLNRRADDLAIVDVYLDLFERLMRAAPVPIVTYFDYLWWINFSLRWQSVHLKLLIGTSPSNTPKITRDYIATKFHPFFCSERFQLWSMNNTDKRIKGAWSTYKWPCRDIIYGYTKDDDYAKGKLKAGSMHRLLGSHKSWNFVDESMRFYDELDPGDFFNPRNDFE